MCSGARLGRQEHGAGARPDADRLPAGVAAAEGEGEAAGDDEASLEAALDGEAGGGEGDEEDQTSGRGTTRECLPENSRARD